MISFPSFCFVALWFSVTVKLLMRSDYGRKKRAAVREIIAERERLGEVVNHSLVRQSKAVLRRAVVVVGGDFARSPRMQYHALSMAKCGIFDEVALVGFDMGNKLTEGLRLREIKKDAIKSESTAVGDYECVVNTSNLISPLTAPNWFRIVFPHPKLHWLMATIYRALACAVVFTWVLMRASLMTVNSHGQLNIVELILIQSPPAVPFVPVIKYVVRPCVRVLNAVSYYFLIVAAWLMTNDTIEDIYQSFKLQQQRLSKKDGRDSKARAHRRSILCPAVAVDWHNFGHTILQADRRPPFVVWLYRFFEIRLCFGDFNITVSEAMRTSLQRIRRETIGRNLTEDVSVLYDAAPYFFGPVQRERFVQEVLVPALHTATGNCRELVGAALPPEWILNSKAACDPQGLFIVASTSWTPDDDYTMVVDALVRIDERLKAHNVQSENGPRTLKKVWLLVTGKGASRQHFEAAVAAANLSPFVTVTTIYLQSYVHYAMTLGAADVGLCMHHSSSGLDLPMKAVDMLGSGLPVVALYYESLSELLDEKRGWFFSNAAELEQILWHQLILPSGSLQEKRNFVAQNRGETWDDSWSSVVLPLLEGSL
ncbi:putative glycosyltransferase [Trypanosoma vivax]|nr:putative glycosyltransferase [Trypanosoma vivax]